MAKGTVWCTCAKCGGKFKMEAIKRNRDEANRWEVWAVGYYDECPDCYKARKAEEREAENQAAAAKAEAQGLPNLTGSPKQIAWATTLRNKRLAYLDGIGERTERKAEFDEFRRSLLTHTDARYWIDSRDYDDVSFARIAMREYNAE